MKYLDHSDGGCHYRWPEWKDIMNKAGFIKSISKKGCSLDNSACDGFFGMLKNEMFYGKDWKEILLKISWVHLVPTSIGTMKSG